MIVRYYYLYKVYSYMLNNCKWSIIIIYIRSNFIIGEKLLIYLDLFTHIVIEVNYFVLNFFLNSDLIKLYALILITSLEYRLIFYEIFVMEFMPYLYCLILYSLVPFVCHNVGLVMSYHKYYKNMLLDI